MSGAAGSSQWMYASGDYTIDQSLRFSGDAGGEPKLTFTPDSDPTSNKQHTVSFWVKRGELEAYSAVISAGGRFDTGIYFNGGANNKDTVTVLTNYAEVGRAIEIDAVLRDVSAWYHIVATWDTNNGTATDRHICWVNGVRQAVGTEATMPQNGSTKLMANGQEITIGMGGRYQHENRFDGCLAEFHCIDGQVLTPTSFGETGDYGEWKPIEYEGSYGNNGFYLDFSDSSALGDDKSGNGNDFTVNSAITASDQLVDSPSNNFATMNPLANANGGTIGNYDSDAFTVTEGNLKTRTSGAADCRILNTLMPATGKWYFEFVVTELAENNRAAVSVGEFDSHLISQEDQAGDHYMLSLGANSHDRLWYYGNEKDDYNYTPATGDIWQFAFDITGTTHKIWIRQNAGNWFGTSSSTFASGSPAQSQNKTSTDTVFYVAHNGLSGSSSSASTVVFNFGQDSSFAGNKTAQGNQDSGGVGDFYYTPPSGFKALCTKNLPAPAITPSEYFDTVLYTGDSSVQSITSLGFQPDFTWIKERSDTAAHQLFDVIRGVTKNIASSANSGETTNDDTLTHFLSNGFTTGDDNRTNMNNETYVAWNWKAGGSGSSNTTGSINSTVSANTDAGFSIVSYTGNATSGATVGHGLSSTPELIILKNRDSVTDWDVFHTSTGATKFLRLNTTAAASTNSAIWNDTAPTSSVFSLGNNADPNSNNEAYIAYCFHSVDGYSKVGSYIGNGNADGTFVYTGFRPMMIISKYVGTENWNIIDTKRSTYNLMEDLLKPDDNAAEIDTQIDIDFLSNGFKPRINSGFLNGVSHTIIYIAWAETPFKYANAR